MRISKYIAKTSSKDIVLSSYPAQGGERAQSQRVRRAYSSLLLTEPQQQHAEEEKSKQQKKQKKQKEQKEAKGAKGAKNMDKDLAK